MNREDPQLSIEDLKIMVPAELKLVQSQITKLSAEIDLMTKMNKEFNENMYEGIDVEKDSQKLKSYVSYYAEFRAVITREQNIISRELTLMNDQLEGLHALTAILASLES